MKYTGVKCSACEKIFDESADAVVCPVCGAPHHRECWIKTGRCAYNNLHAEGYAWIFPENVKKAREEEDSKREQRDTKPEIKLKNGENIISCPVCGSANYENDIYCLRCGAKLSGEADDGIDYDENGEFSGSPFGAGERSDGYYRNLRSDFDRYGGISPNALVDGIPCSEYSDYVGGSRPGKIIRKISTLERYDRKISWTWAALFLGPIWFLWRKMKKEGAVISMILIFLAAMYGVVQLNPTVVAFYKEMLSVVSQVTSGSMSLSDMQNELLEIQEEYEEKIADSYSTGRLVLLDVIRYLALAGMPIVYSAFAMHFYRKKVKEEILRIRGECSDMEQYRYALNEKGGTSAAGAILGAAVVIVSALCSVYLPLIISIII